MLLKLTKIKKDRSLLIIFLSSILLFGCFNHQKQSLTNKEETLTIIPIDIDENNNEEKKKITNNQNHKKTKKKRKNNHHGFVFENDNDDFSTTSFNDFDDINLNTDDNNDNTNTALLFDQQMIDDIKDRIDHIDVENNIINKEQIRLIRCQKLIDQINAFQKEKTFYQWLLLPLQKTLVIKQKLIKHYHQSLIGQIIMIIINLYFGYKLFMSFKLLLEKNDFETKEVKIDDIEKEEIKENKEIINENKEVIKENKEEKKILSKEEFADYFDYKGNFSVFLDDEYNKYLDSLNENKNSSLTNNNKTINNHKENNIEETKTIKKKKNNTLLIKDDWQLLTLAILKKLKLVSNKENKEENYFRCYQYYQFYQTCCFCYFINYFLNNLFNNDNERLFNTINYFFRYRYISQKTLNHYLFVDEKQVGSFLYDHSMYLLHNQQRYYYVPLLFDNVRNYFNHFFKIVYIFLVVLFFIPYGYYFYGNYQAISYYVVRLMYDDDLLLHEIINNLLKEEMAINYNLTFFSTFNFLKNNFFYYLCYLFVNKKKINGRFADTEKQTIAKTILRYGIFFIRKEFIILIFIIFSFVFILFDYLHIFFHGENNQQPHFLTIIFYWQHCFHELIKNVLKSLPIINKHYFIQPSLCKFWYPIVTLIPYLLSWFLIFICFHFFHLDGENNDENNEKNNNNNVFKNFFAFINLQIFYALDEYDFNDNALHYKLLSLLKIIDDKAPLLTKELNNNF